jgi:hypothetical protein
LFVGAKAFMNVAKRGDAFLLYIHPSLDVESRPYEIPFKYQKFKNVFENKNVNTSHKH